MPCSAYTLSLATIAAVISVALIAIAFSTDNWSRITIDRLKLEVILFLKLLFRFFGEGRGIKKICVVVIFLFASLTLIWRLVLLRTYGAIWRACRGRWHF